jgi:hypothetical protein
MIKYLVESNLVLMSFKGFCYAFYIYFSDFYVIINLYKSML